MLNKKDVTIVSNNRIVGYNNSFPYHPHIKYPEYPFNELNKKINSGYDLFRTLLFDMELDKINFGNINWNPFGSLIKPGNKVILKPNLVTHKNWDFKNGNFDTDSLITHGSIIRAILDYVFIALKGYGKIIIADAPVQSANWAAILDISGLKQIQNYYKTKGFSINLIDFRLYMSKMKNDFSLSNTTLKHDIIFYEIDLGKDSLLYPIIKDYKKFAVSSYGTNRMKKVHNYKNNSYLIPEIIFDSDCIINIPKLKFHSKAGITCSLKNLVGINGHKDYLPHFRIGSSLKGYDEYPFNNHFESIYYHFLHKHWKAKYDFTEIFFLFICKLTYRLFPKGFNLKSQGGWHGNDTLWRTVLDINRLFFYYNVNSKTFSDTPQRNYISIVDGIIGGENESPLSPTPKLSKVLIGGFNPVAIDVVAASIIGFDYEKIPLLKNSFNNFKLPLTEFKAHEILVKFNNIICSFNEFYKIDHNINFNPTIGWKNNIEK